MYTLRARCYNKLYFFKIMKSIMYLRYLLIIVTFDLILCTYKFIKNKWTDCKMKCRNYKVFRKQKVTCIVRYLPRLIPLRIYLAIKKAFSSLSDETGKNHPQFSIWDKDIYLIIWMDFIFRQTRFCHVFYTISLS